MLNEILANYLRKQITNLTMPQFHSNSDGFSLIEILISILILSFGIFGAMKMQLASMQASMQSYFYSTAMELISDVADRMRSNQVSRHVGDIGDNNSFLPLYFQSGKEISSARGSCYGTHCSSDQLANAAISEWLQQVDAALPNARAVICRDSAPWNSATESLTWECSSDDNASVVIKLGWAEQNEEANPQPRLAVAVSPYFD